MDETIRFIDFFPAMGMYKPGEIIRLFLECETKKAGSYTFNLRIFRGLNLVKERFETRILDVGKNKLDFSCVVPKRISVGYGIEIGCENANATPANLTTAFDVLSDWTTYPRYGFICDFTGNRADSDETIQTLAKYHLNGLQFYDWQYRHDDLVPPQDEFLDPLNRSLSLVTIRKLIKSAHAHGMAAMPYLAVHAASVGFWKSHPEWMLFDKDHQPIPFGENFLGIMNPEDNSPWQEHLLAQCRKVLSELPFNGLHIDQYGEPKSGFNAQGKAVDIPKAFHDFIQAASEQNFEKPLIFNAVGNWPIVSLASSKVAFNYIEIWAPDTHYSDLARIVRNARKLSGEKPVVIALYIPATRQVNHLLADAVIYSAGGNRILIGESGRLLSDPYFPKHEAIPDELDSILRRRADFMLRYEEWISPLVKESKPKALSIPEGIAAFFRKVKKGASLSLVNLSSESDLCWNIEYEPPENHKGFMLSIQLSFVPQKVWLLNPDVSTPPIQLEFSLNGKTIVNVPELNLWSVLLFER